MKKMLRGRIATSVIALMTILTLGLTLPMTVKAYTPVSATVTANSAKVRSETTTTSSVVGSLTKGNTIEILDETKDAAGQLWYKVNVTGGTGYVRSDLVSKSGATASAATATSTAAVQTTPSVTTTPTVSAATATSTAATLPKTSVTAVNSLAATVATSKANVRSGAGTAYSSVGSVANGDSVTVTGKATGTDSKKWYQITFGGRYMTRFLHPQEN